MRRKITKGLSRTITGMHLFFGNAFCLDFFLLTSSKSAFTLLRKNHKWGGCRDDKLLQWFGKSSDQFGRNALQLLSHGFIDLVWFGAFPRRVVFVADSNNTRWKLELHVAPIGSFTFPLVPCLSKNVISSCVSEWSGHRLTMLSD